ncbi:MAG TPA: ATP-binding protein [Gemmatimonadaceae bacterium]|nr:ATP-binding protein [Gemmatimonadaceae bacterium]
MSQQPDARVPTEGAVAPHVTVRRAPGRTRPGWEGKRPTLWRLPLVAFLATGLFCLNYLDGRLSSDYRKSAVDLAVQTDAQIESAVNMSAAAMHELRVLLADAPTPGERRARFEVFGGAFAESHPEVMRVYRLDDRGAVRDFLPTLPAEGGADLTSENHLLVAETAEALNRARETGKPATTGVIVLRNDTLGFVIYDPIIVDGRLDGYVGTAVAYTPLLRSVLSPRLHDRFGYRIADSAGRVLAVSTQYPNRVSSFASQTVTLPGGRYWTLDVPVGVFQPRAARVTMWIVGAVLLFVVFLLVLREDARAERIAMHSFNLELLSRDLLDANVRLEERAQQVNEANMAKSRFLANVSHELRTPLNAIVGYNALALSGLYGDVTPELRGAHERIRAAADHLLRVVNDVLDLSKIEVGRMDVDRRAVALEPLLEGIVSIIEPVAEAKDMRIDLVVARGLPMVVTDARHVRQILLSLTTNAIKFTERGAITIVAKCGEGPEGGKVLIAVEDTGIGIEPSDLDRIFDEFEQVRPSGRGDSIARGTGLGLAVSRKLARLLGGEVHVDSQVGLGSRFTLSLPIGTLPVADREVPLGVASAEAASKEQPGPRSEAEMKVRSVVDRRSEGRRRP